MTKAPSFPEITPEMEAQAKQMLTEMVGESILVILDALLQDIDPCSCDCCLHVEEKFGSMLYSIAERFFPNRPLPDTAKRLITDLARYVTASSTVQ